MKVLLFVICKKIQYACCGYSWLLQRRIQVSFGGDQVQKDIERTKLENIRMHQQEVNLRLCMMEKIVKFSMYTNIQVDNNMELSR